MFKAIRKSGLIMLCGALLTVGASSGAAAAGAQSAAGADDAYRIAALGDSLAVGYQPGMDETTSDPYGYDDRLFEQALFRGNAELGNFGIVGLRSEGLLHLLQGAADGKTLKAGDIQDFSNYADRDRLEAQADRAGGRTAELADWLSGADLVVMTIGGNDFTDLLGSLQTMPLQEANAFLEGNIRNRMNNYAETAESILRLTARLAPQARILLADQYLPLPRLFAKDLYDSIYEKAIEPLTETVDTLTAKLRGEGIRAEAVHVAERFKGREGSLTHMSVALGGDSKPDIHPTDEGYEVMAQAFASLLWPEYRKPSPRPAGVPISVIVAGKELSTGNAPVLKPPGITFVALRDISEAMGADLLWDPATSTATFRQNGREVAIAIGAGTIRVNGLERPIAAPAYLQTVGKEKKTYVPLAVIADGLGYHVQYSKPLQAAFINP
jgi:lysophospholipase L1-like esterase